MSFISNGLIAQFLNFIGVEITTADGQYLAFLTVSVLSVVVLVIFLVFIFKFLVYLKRG